MFVATRLVWVSAVLLSAATCGFRSASTDDFYLCVAEERTGTGDTGTGGTGDDLEGHVRSGSCDAPFELPYGAIVKRSGKLVGCSQASGWCGQDGGTEDVYRLRVPHPMDVSIRFDVNRTDFVPVLRTVRVGLDEPAECVDAAAEHTDTCLYLAGQDPAGVSWYAEPEHDYYVFVDSPSGSRGEYAFEMRAGPEAVSDRCLDGATEVDLGATPHFEDNGTLPPTHGFSDGKCNAPGSEKVYKLIFPGGGTLTAQLTSAQFWSSLSLGPGCAGSTQYACVAETKADQFEPLVHVGGGPGTVMYLAVDQQQVGGGDYNLTIDFK
ncbi:MAG: hypothetical protein V3V08_08785 [Nannocystaceae bacterium]